MGILPPSLLSIVTKNQQISFVTVLELSCELKHQSTWRSGETKTTTILTDRSRRMETLAVMLCCPAHLRPMRELVCFHLHIFCEGSTNSTNASGKKIPTVLFEAGDGPFESGMMVVAENALANGSISRYCYSDRPGFGWSD